MRMETAVDIYIRTFIIVTPIARSIYATGEHNGRAYLPIVLLTFLVSFTSGLCLDFIAPNVTCVTFE